MDFVVVVSAVNLVVIGSLVLSVVLVGARALTLWSDLTLRMGPVGWDFSKSWGSTLAAFGAVLGTILATAGVLPATTKYLTNDTYAALNLLFGVIVIFAPLVYIAFQRVEKRRGKSG